MLESDGSDPPRPCGGKGIHTWFLEKSFAPRHGLAGSIKGRPSKISDCGNTKKKRPDRELRPRPPLRRARASSTGAGACSRPLAGDTVDPPRIHRRGACVAPPWQTLADSCALRGRVVLSWPSLCRVRITTLAWRSL